MIQSTPDEEIKIEANEKKTDSVTLSENEATYNEDTQQETKSIKRRSLPEEEVEMIEKKTESTEPKLVYRSLGSPHLSQPIKIQM